MSDELTISFEQISNENDNNNLDDKTYYKRIIFSSILSSIISILYCFIGYYYITITHLLLILVPLYVMNYFGEDRKKIIDIKFQSNFSLFVIDLILIFIVSKTFVTFIISLSVFMCQLISLITIHNYKIKLLDI